MLSTPAAFSIFAIKSTSVCPCSAKNEETSSTSFLEETKERATKSIPCSSPNKRSALSCSLRYTFLSVLPGKLILFLFESVPPVFTVQTMSSPSIFSTSSSTSPLFISTLSPAKSSLLRFLYETETMFSLPTTSLTVSVNLSPFFNSILPFS